MSHYYKQDGFQVFPNFLNQQELAPLETILLKFHSRWLKENPIQETGLINSAYITGPDFLDHSDRRRLFRLIASHKLRSVKNTILKSPLVFMNTQLFFDPYNQNQSNYWHRDIQYAGMPIEQQQQLIPTTNVVHFRIALRDENGLEFIPGSHMTWDRPEEFEVRMELNGAKKNDSLEYGCKVPLNAGDLLVFSANIIHRGLYGKDRFSFDILLCDDNPELLKFAKKDCMPDHETLSQLENPEVFRSPIAYLSN